MNTSTIQKNSEMISSFFPRIIREFDDGPDEEPMMYGEKY
jgi:hypothetical protein